MARAKSELIENRIQARAGLIGRLLYCHDGTRCDRWSSSLVFDGKEFRLGPVFHSEEAALAHAEIQKAWWVERNETPKTMAARQAEEDRREELANA